MTPIAKSTHLLLCIALLLTGSHGKATPTLGQMHVQPIQAKANLAKHQRAKPKFKRRSRRQVSGFDSLKRRLGPKMPTGKGIITGHVEKKIDGNYLPRVKEPRFANVYFVPGSGPSGPSGHANYTAQVIYGQGSLAPGVKTVYSFSPAGFIGPGILKTGSDQPPDARGIRVFNHSWIAQNRAHKQVLARCDYLVDQQDVIMCVGVNNAFKSKVPHLLASAHNVIAVGKMNGQSSGGYTQIQGKGRCKPDLVAHGSAASITTPVVTAIATCLLETADKMTQTPTAKKAQVIKAVLLAGAVKPKNWKPEPGKPLDEHLGAGIANIHNSYKILVSPLQMPNTKASLPDGLVQSHAIKKRYGWHFGLLGKQGVSTYTFDVRRDLSEASVILTWHRRVIGKSTVHPKTGKAVWQALVATADFDLRMYRLGPLGHKEPVASSTSSVDNVEHIYLKKLKAGRYVMQISRMDRQPLTWDYALAWRFEKQ